MEGETTDMLNFRIVNESMNIWRGGQPLSEIDIQQLIDNGIKNITKLNPERLTLNQELIIYKNRFELFYCPINTIEQILTEPDLYAVKEAVDYIEPNTYVHCEHGEDRTGVVIALFRIKCGWPKEQAYREMKEDGYHSILVGLDKMWADLTK